jgi:hypothetical protein
VLARSRHCSTGDGGLLALRDRPMGDGLKPPRAALAEDRRGERRGKGVLEASGGDQGDDCRSKCRELKDGIRTGLGSRTRDRVWRVPMYWPGGVRHRGGVNLICGSCRERWKADADMVSVWLAGAIGSPPSGRNREGLSTVAAPAGGRVGRAHCCARPPSEPDVHVSAHPAQASPEGSRADRSAGPLPSVSRGWQWACMRRGCVSSDVPSARIAT